MPQLQNLVLTDRAGTPVNHTFTPKGKPNGIAQVVKSDGVPIGDWIYTIGTRKSADRRKVTLKLAVPVVETQTVNGIDTPKIVRTSYVNMEFNFAATSTTQERANVVGMAASSLDASKVLVDSVLVDLEEVW